VRSVGLCDGAAGIGQCGLDLADDRRQHTGGEQSRSQRAGGISSEQQLAAAGVEAPAAPLRSCVRVANGFRPRWPRADQGPPGQLLSRHRRPHPERAHPCEQRRRLARLPGQPPPLQDCSPRELRARQRSAGESAPQRRARRERMRGLCRRHRADARLTAPPLRRRPGPAPRNPLPTSRPHGDRPRSKPAAKPHLHHRIQGPIASAAYSRRGAEALLRLASSADRFPSAARRPPFARRPAS